MKKWEYLLAMVGLYANIDVIHAGTDSVKIQSVTECLSRRLPDHEKTKFKLQGFNIMPGQIDVVDVLDALGADGWELVAARGDSAMILKRPEEE